MIKTIHSFFLVLATLSMSAMFSTASFASGAYGGAGGGLTGGSSVAQPREIDPVYEAGKAIYTGRQKGIDKINYCVKVDDQLLPVKRKTLKPYKKTSYSKLANNLFNCDQPEAQIGTQLGREDLTFVLYYLNKRHRLKLAQS